MICFCTGIGLLGLSWFMGVGAAFTAAFTGGLAGAAMGVSGAIALMLTACLGAFLVFIGIVWIALRVIADQTGDEAKQRYRDVQR
jgi:hypothetical protein